MNRPSLIVTPALTGPVNMAIDLTLLDLACAGLGPFVRVYSWAGPWISLGYFQRARTAIDEGLAGALRVGVVGRPTGGKALLHHRDVTYAVALPPVHELTRLSISDSYRELCQRLIAALASLGLEGTLGTSPEGSVDRGPAPCAAEVHIESIMVGSKKLVGSAQVRRGGAVLQHGSIPVEPPEAELIRCLEPPGFRAGRLLPGEDGDFVGWYRARTTTLRDEGCGASVARIQAAVIDRLSRL
ncbi:MAG: hypothetical protein HY815_31705 [Candidatus Riflebacteria bacterium]|nr:hypothetical protein [Candidatus Riflebacteria bacterium]